MDFMVTVLVGVICMYTGAKIMSSEEQNKVFNRYHLEVTDVKKYNQYCGWLAIGFGVAAMVTLYIGSLMNTWVSSLFTLALVGEAAVVLFLYKKIEAKLAKDPRQIMRRKSKGKKAGKQNAKEIENKTASKE